MQKVLRVQINGLFAEGMVPLPSPFLIRSFMVRSERPNNKKKIYPYSTIIWPIGRMTIVTNYTLQYTYSYFPIFAYYRNNQLVEEGN